MGVIFLPTTAKIAYLAGSDVLTVAFMRGFIAAIILASIALLTGKALTLPRGLVVNSVIVGLAGVTFVYGMLAAITSINISLAVLILYLYPLIVAAYEHFNGKIELQLSQWVWAFVACLGLALILSVKFEVSNVSGVLLAFLAMVSAVVITITNVKVVDACGSLVANLHMTLWGMIFFSIALFGFGEFLKPQTTIGWAGLLGNGIAYCIAWVSFFAGAKIIGATRASMITLTEPLVAAFVAWLIFNETFTLLQWCGFAVVIMALYMFEHGARRAR